MNTKAATERRIEAAHARIRRLTERIGELMTQRADAEDKLADLIRKRNATLPENQPGAEP